jgi:hypothetical protein
LMVTWPATLKVFITNRDDATGMATVEIVNEGSEVYDGPEVRVDRRVDGGWTPAARARCEEGEQALVFPKGTVRVSVASMNCVPSSLAPGQYRRVVRLQRFASLARGLDETVQFEELFAALFPKAHFWSLRQAPWSFTTPHLRVGDALVCACDGLVVGRERSMVKLLVRPLGYELCLAPPDGGACEDVLLDARNTGDFPP